jgi:Protein of unknown function (DUF1064)
MKRTNKYNAKKVEFRGKTFDSKAELDYYMWLMKQEDVIDIELQPVFELQPKFTNSKGKNVMAIKYKADFKITYEDGSSEVIDVKGMETADFKLKKKLFEYKYDQSLTLICKAPKYMAPQEWVELDELKSIRRERKKLKGEN